MAESLETFEFKSFGDHAPKYDYTRWTNGGIWRAKQGVDFTVSPESFRSSLNSHAHTKGMKVRTSVDKQSGTVTFQFSARTVEQSNPTTSTRRAPARQNMRTNLPKLRRSKGQLARLTGAEVRQIRELSSTGSTVSEIVYMFDLPNTSIVKDLLAGKTYTTIK
jgi:hypothetical protein